jgi:hypothetical protein
MVQRGPQLTAEKQSDTNSQQQPAGHSATLHELSANYQMLLGQQHALLLARS